MKKTAFYSLGILPDTDYRTGRKCQSHTRKCTGNPVSAARTHFIYKSHTAIGSPQSTRQSDYLQFNLSRSKDFSDASTILSKPKPWCMFNPHKVLENGTWYWRVRSVSKEGKEFPWSRTYSFTVTDDVPQFVTPEADVFLSNVPKTYPRIYCFSER